MKAVDVRNRIIDGLHGYLNIPVILAEQVSPESEPPYMIYSITAPYIPGNTLGHFISKRDEDGNVIRIRAEQAGMTISFTVCSQNRQGDDGKSIFGEDEAMNLAEKAQGWFLHARRQFLSPEIVVDSVENAASRSVLMIDEEANRYGFDVSLKYIREDTADVGAIETVTAKGREDLK